MKMKIFAGIGIVLMIVVLFITLKPKSFLDTFNEKTSKVESYILSGDMELSRGETTKSYAIEVGYQKGKQDLFKVTLIDKEFNQEQTIIRNKKGVFVVTPSLNQIFKFEGDWPMNTPKPYLLQSIVDIVNQKDAQISKEKDGTLIHAKVSYPNNRQFHHEEIFVDADGKIRWIKIYNKDHHVEFALNFKQCRYNIKMKKSYFDVPQQLDKSVMAPIVQEEDLPLYPVQVFSSKLRNVNKMQTNGAVKHILEYGGEKNFTVIETIPKAVETTQTVIMPGEMMDVLDVVGFYDENHMNVIRDGVEISIFSDELSLQQMIEIINSMQVAVMK